MDGDDAACPHSDYYRIRVWRWTDPECMYGEVQGPGKYYAIPASVIHVRDTSCFSNVHGARKTKNILLDKSAHRRS